jgi:protein TonB
LRTLFHYDRGVPGGAGRGPVVSAVLHVSSVALLVLVAAKAPRVVPVHLPGSANGKHLLLTYSTGAAPSEAESVVTKQVKAVTKPEPKQKAAPVAQAAEAKPMAEQGSGSAGLSGLGDGNMTIAALKVSPRPQPDLSDLAHGRGGNVILSAVIDTHGAITELTVVQSLSASIDQQVMATVRGWSFVPATKDGQPVASQQEIVLHYERV